MATVRRRALDDADANETDAVRPPGELAGGPTPLDVADVLNKVPPHLLGDQIVAEAQRLTGVTSVALYLVDIDGTRLLRLAGSEGFPPEIDAPLTVGPEIPREGIPRLREVVGRELPGSVMAPLLLRGRAIGVLLAVDAPEQPLTELGRQAAAALGLANVYTDVFDTVRRRRETSPAAEIQKNLLPPRIARISGGILAGNVLPGYEIGGDWFDYVENRDGAWIGIAGSLGKGTTAAALGGVSLGAFRAKRRVDAALEATALAIHHTMQEVAVDGACVSVILGRWQGPTSTFRFVTCGYQPPLLITEAGDLVEIPYTEHAALGVGESERTFSTDRRRLEPGERLLLLSDGVLDRRTADGEPFGLAGVRRVVAGIGDTAAATTVRALSDAVTAASSDPLEDDARMTRRSSSSPRRARSDDRRWDSVCQLRERDCPSDAWVVPDHGGHSRRGSASEGSVGSAATL